MMVSGESNQQRTVARRHGQPPNAGYDGDGTAGRQRGSDELKRRESKRAGPGAAAAVSLLYGSFHTSVAVLSFEVPN